TRPQSSPFMCGDDYIPWRMPSEPGQSEAMKKSNHLAKAQRRKENLLCFRCVFAPSRDMFLSTLNFSRVLHRAVLLTDLFFSQEGRFSTMPRRPRGVLLGLELRRVRVDAVLGHLAIKRHTG